jgi:ribonuclease J
VYVDGSSVGDVSEAQLKDRRILGEEGFISITVVVDSVTGKLSTAPAIHARGFAEDDGVFDVVLSRIAAELERVMSEGATDTVELQQVIRRTVGRWVSDRFRRRPMIIPVVVSV